MRIFVAAMAFMLFIPSAAFAVRINEIMYNPAADNSYAEWIEVWNDGNDVVDLTGWRLCSSPLRAGYIAHGQPSTKPTNNTGMLLPANGYAIITDGATGSTVLGNFTVDLDAMLLHVDAGSMCGGLNNNGDTIILTSTAGVVDNVTYTDIAKRDYSIERDSSGAWLESLVQKGTPGYVNSVIQQGPPPNPPPANQPNPPAVQQAPQNDVITQAVPKTGNIVVTITDAPKEAEAGSMLPLHVKLFNNFSIIKTLEVSEKTSGVAYTFTLNPKVEQIIELPIEIWKTANNEIVLNVQASDGNSTWKTQAKIAVKGQAAEQPAATVPEQNPSGAFTFNIGVLGQFLAGIWSQITSFFSNFRLPAAVSS
ncbi:MAG: lamin tail domain-containing protein [Candidatus Aenigmatarchaeota archaeon]